MRTRRLTPWIGLGGLGVLALGLSSMLACPLAHDDYETDRPCVDRTDCVGKERCDRQDAGLDYTGECRVPSDGPCGWLDGGTGGFYCFPNAEGTEESCYHELHDECLLCGLDGGVPVSLCPEDDCLVWKDRWSCR